MKIQSFCKLKLRTILGRTLSINYLRDRLLKPICKFVRLVIKINSKVQKLKIYDKAISNFINSNR